jgi:hypothetical protein
LAGLPCGTDRRIGLAVVQCLHDANAREHRRARPTSRQYQRFHRGLPFHGIVFCLGQLGDVECGVAQCDEGLVARHRDRIEKPLIHDTALWPEQREVNHVQPTKNAVDDCPKYRVFGGVGYRDAKGGAKPDAVFCSLDSNTVVPIFVHVHLSFHLANAKTDKPDHQQDGSGYHDPIRRIFHRWEHAH